MKRGRRETDTDRGRGADRATPEEADPSRFRWIVDGHNAIFRTPAWEALQVAGQRREARRRLEASLETFGRAAGVQVWVVYDGNLLDRNPDAVDRPHLRTEYSWPPSDADTQICYLAERALRLGERVVVVTADRRTLAGSLPAGVRVMDVGRFFGDLQRRILRRPEKWIGAEGLEDVERHFLSRSPHAEDREAAAEGEGSPPEDPDRLEPA